MATKDEALNIAIELLQIQIGELVLQKMRSGNDIPVSRCTITNSEIDALFNDIKKEALDTKRVCENEAQPSQETVACPYPCGWGKNTHPAPLWKGLSDDEIEEELKKMWDKGLIPSYNIVAFARTIEQTLNEKNNANNT